MSPRPALLAALLLAGCGRAPDPPDPLVRLERELAAEGPGVRDPAAAAALRDPIMVDPALTGPSNANAVRPPPRPDPHAMPIDTGGAAFSATGTTPLRPAPPARGDCVECRAARGALTLGALAERQRRRRAPACATSLAYGAGWATRLSADLPLYPDARLVEAAGTDAGGCGLRIVRFASDAAPARMLDWYARRAAAAGYDTRHRADARMDVLAGTRGGAGYTLYVTARAGGSMVDLLVDAGA